MSPRAPISITDPADPRVAFYRSPATGQPQDPERFVAETEHVVRRLLESPLHVESILAVPARLARLGVPIPEHVIVHLADPALIDAIVGFDRHRGVLAIARRPPDPDPRALLLGRPRATVVVAQGLADPVNVGAILRSARAFAADLVILDRTCGDPWSRRGVRSAIGNGFFVPLTRTDDLPALLGRLRDALRPRPAIVAAALGPRSRPLAAFERPDHCIILLGSEGEGLAPELLDLADTCLEIPMAPGVDSLNVAAAAAVFLYALR